MTVKAHEDKTYRGAFIASLTLPWGFAVNADEGGGGYHFVWARDEYQQVSSLLAAGDRAAADRAVTWLFTHQQQADGTFPQNSHVDGTPDQRNVQLDETAFPIILAWQLARTDDATWAGVRKAADASWRAGPATPQERWEETGGYSNSTLAGDDRRARRGLRPRAPARRRRPRARCGWASPTSGSATWRSGCSRPTARSATATTTSASTTTATPNDGSERDFGNAAGVHKENAVVDGGILDAVRLGVKAPNDPLHRRLAAGDRRVAGHRHPERARLAPLHLRRLRREGRRVAVDVQHAGHRGSRVAAAGRRARRVRGRQRPLRRCRTCRRWPTRPTTAT